VAGDRVFHRNVELVGLTMQDGRVPRCVPPLLSPNRSSLNLLHSVKNRAPAAIQVCFSSPPSPDLCLSLPFPSDHCRTTTQRSTNTTSTTAFPLTLISRLKNDKSLSSAPPGNVSKTLKNFMNIVVVNVKSSKSVSGALEVACESFFPSSSATHLPIVEKSGCSTPTGRPHRMSLHVLDLSLNVHSMSTLRMCPSGLHTPKPNSSPAMFNMRVTFSIVPSPFSPAWTSYGTNTCI
jgi:hypothetical protein